MKNNIIALASLVFMISASLTSCDVAHLKEDCPGHGLTVLDNGDGETPIKGDYDDSKSDGTTVLNIFIRGTEGMTLDTVEVADDSQTRTEVVDAALSAAARYLLSLPTDATLTGHITFRYTSANGWKRTAVLDLAPYAQPYAGSATLNLLMDLYTVTATMSYNPETL